MLDGFGLYPVSLQIDIDSYDGDWRHVARFRNRSGWLAVAEAQIWSGNELCATLPMIVGCDENEEEIPAFIAANLLGSVTSYPEACYEPAPPALDDLLDQQRAEVRKRWLRENVAAIAAIHEQAEHALLEVETKVAAQTRKSDRAIARMRRQSRFLLPDDPLKTLLADAIAEEEGWQDRMIDWLGERRNELRQHYDELERKASKGLRPRIAVEVLYQINWRHRTAPTSETVGVLEELQRDTRYTATSPASSLHLDDEQIAALKKLAIEPGWIERTGAILPRSHQQAPAPRTAPPRRIEIDWAAMGGAPTHAGNPPSRHEARDVQHRPAAPPAPLSPRSASPPAAPAAKPKTRLEKTQAKRNQFQAKLEAIRAHRAGLPPGSGRFLDAQRKERRFVSYIAAFDAEIASMHSRILPADPETPIPAHPIAPESSPPPSLQSAPSPAPNCELQSERAALVEQLRQLEIQGQKFRQGSPKMRRNQLARIEISRKIAALDRQSDPLPVSPPVASQAKTKQDLLDEMLRRAGASTGDPPSA